MSVSPYRSHYQTVNDVSYTTCLGENQDGDVLESGRNNVRHFNCRRLTDLTCLARSFTDLVFAFK
jgi:hypothetical protein